MRAQLRSWSQVLVCIPTHFRHSSVPFRITRPDLKHIRNTQLSQYVFFSSSINRAWCREPPCSQSRQNGLQSVQQLVPQQLVHHSSYLFLPVVYPVSIPPSSSDDPKTRCSPSLLSLSCPLSLLQPHPSHCPKYWGQLFLFSSLIRETVTTSMS